MCGGSACVLRGRRKTLDFFQACHCYRVVFSWQALRFMLVHCPISWQAQHFVTWQRCCIGESQWQRRANLTGVSTVVAGAAFCGSFAKIILFELRRNRFTQEAVDFTASKNEKWRTSRTKCSFWKLLM